MQVFNLRQPSTQQSSIVSPLKWQTRCVACYADQKGYFVGSIEGRVAVQNLNEIASSQKNFTFKCHRQNSDVYAVNSIAVHPTVGTFVTAGTVLTVNPYNPSYSWSFVLPRVWSRIGEAAGSVCID